MPPSAPTTAVAAATQKVKHAFHMPITQRLLNGLLLLLVLGLLYRRHYAGNLKTTQEMKRMTSTSRPVSSALPSASRPHNQQHNRQKPKQKQHYPIIQLEQPSGCPKELPTFSVISLPSGQHGNTVALRRAIRLSGNDNVRNNKNNVCTLNSTLIEATYRDSFCMEGVLHEAMRAHPCHIDLKSYYSTSSSPPLDVFRGVDFFWADTRFLTHFMSGDAAAGYRNHFKQWMHYFNESSSLSLLQSKVFFYLPNWRDPPLHGVDSRVWKRHREELQYQPFGAVNIVTHNIGMNIQKKHPCIMKCMSASKHGNPHIIDNYFDACLDVMCKNARQTYVVPYGFAQRAERHVVIPFSSSSTTSSSAEKEKEYLLQMSGEYKGNLARQRLFDLFKETMKKSKKETNNKKSFLPLLWSDGTDDAAEMASSYFCLETQNSHNGLMTTPRLTRAILSGCIPVLICDQCIYPFERTLNYTDFSIRISERNDIAIEDLPNRLQRMVVQPIGTEGGKELLRLQLGLKEVRDVFESSTTMISLPMIDRMLQEIQRIRNGN
eukprot:PhM_4_TR10414/c0_g1_i2/m.22446